MNNSVLLCILIGALSSTVSAQQSAQPSDASCCNRVEVIANKSSGYRNVPEYLSIWVEPASRHWAFDPAFVVEAREAFGVWSDAGVPVIFDFTSDSTSAMIRIFWRNRFNDGTSGRSTWWIANGQLRRVDMEIALAAQPGVDKQTVRAVVMHEIGHLLGFRHANESDSIMSYYIGRPELSQRDLTRMRQRFALQTDRP